MLNVKIIGDVVKSVDGQLQLQVEVKQGPTLAPILREVAPQVYRACEHTLRASAELMKSSEAEWKSRFWEDDSVEDCATLLAAWPDEVMIHDRWMLRSRLKPWIRAEVYVISPYLALAAAPACTYNGFVFPCGVTLQFGPLNRIDIAKLATLFLEIPPPDTWMQATNLLFLLGGENDSFVSALYALQDRFSKEMATLRDKIPDEIQQADVTIVDCEAIWQYFQGQFRGWVEQRNEGLWEKLTEGLP